VKRREERKKSKEGGTLVDEGTPLFEGAQA